MLKITSIENELQKKLVLEGKLTDPWLTELESAWIEAQMERGSQGIVIDLKDVTAISERGQQLLRNMAQEGAKVNCCRGVFTRHLVRMLGRHQGNCDRKR